MRDKLISILVAVLLIAVPFAALGQVILWQHMAFTVKPCAVCTDPYAKQLTNMRAYNLSGVQVSNQFHVIAPAGYGGVGGVPQYVATWDGVASCVNVTMDRISAVQPDRTIRGVNMAFSGWPMVAC